ncbi:MAG: ribulose-phosphate 3-epimerase [Alphaproteobacteria bacterium]|uniref:Ribulose-phosphate 3-epimerase n=1 Tax=PS1 clade bacterium TaxID=2175152 RepID=A0A368DIZ7_9PROT|nr:ribulose-phosphate 3-epimerase [Rhodobiaceae bacterium]OUT75447.1 MAG: ribulose-phosphate 3-epimerase [Rhizobiales bacterium TMED25]RCL71818.1 MAG: ribulose-phosphate 3-epimerase [PS1 clade bacterium]|tara:strand:+ start:1050 stop:1700 length:651 start_codon:yes stop_codon:yes gene_type:complete
MQKIKIAPSILSADFSKLADEIKAIERAGADLIHIDVMDGHFVNNITFGPVLIKSIRDVTELPFDVHLMINPAHNFIKDFVESGSDTISIHIEIPENIQATIDLIKSFKKKVGLAINPDTDIKQLVPYLDSIDQIIIMSVYPGFAGQSFIENTIDRISSVKKMIEHRKIEIEVDGGINSLVSGRCIDAGSAILVAGSAVFKGSLYKENIQIIRNNK